MSAEREDVTGMAFFQSLVRAGISPTDAGHLVTVDLALLRDKFPLNQAANIMDRLIECVLAKGVLERAEARTAERTKRGTR